MKNQITEQNWNIEMDLENIISKRLDNLKTFTKSSVDVNMKVLVVNDISDYIQSLITSIKQEERERVESMIINSFISTDHCRGDDAGMVSSAIREFKNNLIQSLTEEDGKEKHGK